MCRKTLKQNTRSFKQNEDLDDKMAKFEEISQKEKSCHRNNFKIVNNNIITDNMITSNCRNVTNHAGEFREHK